MAGDPEKFEDNWGEQTAHKTFVWTVVGALLFFGTAFFFVLRH